MATSETKCYASLEGALIQYVSLDWPCAPTSSNSTEFVSCCQSQDTCLEGGLCQSNHGYYVGGCTDPAYSSPACLQHCQAFLPDATYVQGGGHWSCCDSGNLSNGSAYINCDQPTTDSFFLPAPDQIGIVATPPLSRFDPAFGGPTSTSSPMSTNTSSPTSTNPPSPTSTNTSSPMPTSTGLSTGARAGIGVGVALGVVLLIGLAVLIILRKRRKHPATVDDERKESSAPNVAIHEIGQTREAAVRRPVELDSKPLRGELEGNEERKQLNSNSPSTAS